MEKRTIERLKPLNARIGIIGVGHHTYWDQSEGMLDDMHEKLAAFEKMVRDNQVETVNFGLSDCAQSAHQLVPEVKGANIDLLFIDMVTYATSSSISALFYNIHVPIVLIALQPEKALDYRNASTQQQLTNDDIFF